MGPEIKKIHPFPARMAPEILSNYLSAGKKLKIFDPMAGSGTSLVNAMAHGHTATGTDLDPLACLLGKVWCTKVGVHETSLRAACQKIATRTESSWKKVKAEAAFPAHCDEETKKFIRNWFDLKNRKQLAVLSSEIGKLRNQTVKDILWVSLSRLIIAKKRGVSLAMDLSHSRPHKFFDQAPIQAIDHFIDSVKFVEQALKHNESFLKSGKARVTRGDARNVYLKSMSQDLVLTSPPYLNAIDYMRCSKFALVWMGYKLSDLSKIRTVSIGSESARLKEIQSLAEILNLLKNELSVTKLSTRKKNLLARYSHDLRQVLSEVHRVLKKRGKAVFVVGNCFIENTKIDNADLTVALAKNAGLKLVCRKSRIIPPNKRYMPPPKAKRQAGMGSRMREEVILEFLK